MTFTGVSYLAILVAAIASFAFGAVWYMSLSKPWLDAQGFSAETRSLIESGKGQSPALFATTFVCQLIMAWVLAGVIAHLGPGNRFTLWNGVVSGAFCWLGFVVTTLVVNYSYGMKSNRLKIIDGAHWLGVLVIQGAIIGWWGVK
jgi:hypothetical protein